MEDRSVQAAGKQEKRRKKHSLSRRVIRSVAISCAILGLLIQLIGIILYGVILAREYETVAENTAQQASMSVRHGSEFTLLIDQIMSVYTSLTKEEREDMEPEAYRALYAEIQKNRPYYYLEGMLYSYCLYTDVNDVYLAVPDPDSDGLIVVVDPIQSLGLGPGDRKPVSQRFLRSFHNWDKEGELRQYSLSVSAGLVCTVATTVKDLEDNPIAYLFVEVTLRDMAIDLTKYAAAITLAIAVITWLIARIHARWMRKAVIEPVNAIADAAENYVSDKRSGLEKSGHFTDLNIHTGDEVEHLSVTMADMEKSLQDIEKVLTTATAENERISTELGLARRIQAESLPSTFPPFPDRTEFDIYATMHPAKEVGGDFYDFYLLDADHLGLVIADVSGKGVPAALFMMTSRILVKNYMLIGGSPREVLEKVNNQLSKNNLERMFVTVWLGILDLKTGRLTASNAGHEYPIMKRPDGSFEVITDSHGPFLGIKSGIHYRDYVLQMDKGSKLFVYTDGVPEATRGDEKMFGMERLLKSLSEVDGEGPERILEHMRESIDGFVGNAPQFDDITMLCVEFNGPNTRVNESELPAVSESIPVAVDFARQEMEKLGCPAKTEALMCVALDEVMSNIVHYAYGMGIGTVTMRVEPAGEEGGVTITLMDTGVAFNPLEAPEPDLSRTEMEEKPGGLGIFIARKMVDEMQYERVDGRNVLHMTKRF